MTYDQVLADRIRQFLIAEPGLTEKRMFGGLAFLVGGHMAVAASGQGGIMVRVDPAETDALIADGTAERMVMRGRPMGGWLRVGLEALERDEDLGVWVARGAGYARSLPPKG